MRRDKWGDGKLQSICRWNETALKSVLGPFAESDDLIFREKDSSKISEQHQTLKKSENKRSTIHHCLMRGGVMSMMLVLFFCSSVFFLYFSDNQNHPLRSSLRLQELEDESLAVVHHGIRSSVSSQTFKDPRKCDGDMKQNQPSTRTPENVVMWTIFEYLSMHLDKRTCSGLVVIEKGPFLADGCGSSFPAYSHDPELQQDRIELGAQIFVRILLRGSATRCNFQKRDQRSGTPI